MTQTTRRRGDHGEKIAQSHLQRQGFQLEALNWRYSRLGEIDIIAYHPLQHVLVFVEVKTRRGGDFGSPLEAINTLKQERMQVLAEIYLAQRTDNHRANAPDATLNMRFDILGIYFPGGGRPAEIQHVENAF